MTQARFWLSHNRVLVRVVRQSIEYEEHRRWLDRGRVVFENVY